MKEALAVIVPTRGRPSNAARLARAFRETDALDALPVFVVDSDDPELPGYRELLEAGVISRLMVTDGPGGSGLSYPLNYAARRYAELYEHLGFMGDDHLPRTANWDAQVLEELDSLEPRVVYGNDLLQGAALPTAVFMPSRLVRAMGMFAPQAMRHLYLDNFWKALGEELGGLRYLPDTVIEHLHPVAGKAPWDERYAAVNSSERDREDQQAWQAYMSDGRFDSLVRLVRKEYGLDPHQAA